MKGKVKSYDAAENYHNVEIEDEHLGTKLIRIDLMVNGDFPVTEIPENLVGKVVEWNRDYPFISIAEGVSIPEDQTWTAEPKSFPTS